jgi:hypothetical protein
MTFLTVEAGLRLLDRLINVEVAISNEIIDEEREKLYAHLGRLEEYGITKFLTKCKPHGKRSLGCPRNR